VTRTENDELQGGITDYETSSKKNEEEVKYSKTEIAALRENRAEKGKNPMLLKQLSDTGSQAGKRLNDKTNTCGPIKKEDTNEEMVSISRHLL
jgi:hypothetical protein